MAIALLLKFNGISQFPLIIQKYFEKPLVAVSKTIISVKRFKLN